MDAVKFLKEWKRMCDYYGCSCNQCPVGKAKNEYDLLCWDFRDTYQEKFVDIVLDWSVNHIPITNREKFLEVFGVTIGDAAIIPNWGDKEFKEKK